jgi:hypothetical protein
MTPKSVGKYVVKSDLQLLTIPADYKEPNYDVEERLAEKKGKTRKDTAELVRDPGVYLLFLCLDDLLFT